MKSTIPSPRLDADERGRGISDGGIMKDNDLYLEQRRQSTSDIEKQNVEEEDERSSTDTDSRVITTDEEDDGSKELEGSSREVDGAATGPSGGDGSGNGLARVISRALSMTSTKSNFNPGPPPDGGLEAWTAVACSHLIITNTWGFINSWGVFQSYYVSHLSRPPSDISWIGSIQIFLLFFIGTLTGRLTDAGYFRHVLVTGGIFLIVGIFTTAVAADYGYWQVFLAQGICIGLGNGFLFCPTMTIVSTYFQKKRAIAIAITASGSATGGLVFPTMMRQLLPKIGFAWTVRCMGFIVVANMIVAILFLKPRATPKRNGGGQPWVDWMAFREMEYSFYALGSFFIFLGVYFGFYYITTFSRDIIGLGYEESLNLLLVMNGVGVIGRLVPNYFADRVGPINIFVPVALIGAVCVFSWMAVNSVAGLYVWACFYGMAAGGIQSLFPAGLTSLTTDFRKTGVRMGMVFTINSFATLTGPPIAGAIITACGGKYFGAQAFAASTLLVGAGFLGAARAVKARKTTGCGSETGWLVKV
ncbi:major facilitator superfamily domain-containing protein [Apodospora peruviana]|uniref:Major facilitator superfamily domain-containing protein n=1 Tax=Apodospora peruviana TaxID=516989 RepID=A0AAE0HYA7_9PEZI|nr:major facilitator superfamily domain-containing protein [Apodospora peruviana]